MARTKASVGAKVSSGKSSKARCSVAPPPSSNGHSGSGERSSGRSYSGGNTVCPRETPKWQRPITNFFINKEHNDKDNSASDSDNDEITAGSSKSKTKRKAIISDDEDVCVEEEKPKNTVLDETIDLEPLTGENSHKIDEYYKKPDENNDDSDESINDKENNTTNNNTETNNQISGKGKGRGKKSSNVVTKSSIKGNMNDDNEKRKSLKRDLEDVNFSEEAGNSSKKVKVSSEEN